MRKSSEWWNDSMMKVVEKKNIVLVAAEREWKVIL